MAFVDMDAITFYEQPPTKGGPRGEKRPPASNGNVPTVGEQYESRQAFGPSNRPSGRPHDCDLIEVLDMTTSPPDEPLDPSGEVGAGVKQGTGVGARDTANEYFVDRGHGCIGSDPCQEFPSLEEVLSSTKAIQEPQRAGGSGVHLTGRSGESLDHALEKDCKESDSLKSGWEKPILCDDEYLETRDNQDAERQCSDTQNARPVQAEIQDAERDASSSSNVHTNDSLPSEEQDSEQRREQSSLGTPPASTVGSDTGSSTLHRKNELSPPHFPPPRRNSYLSSTASTQIHESIAEFRHNSWNYLSTSGDKIVQADDEGVLQRNNNEKSALLHSTKKRRRSVGGKKLPLKRRFKRRRFSSPLSSSEESETGAESDISRYAPANLCRTLNLSPASSLLSTGREREPNPDDALIGDNERSKRRSLSRTAVVYKQQCWEGEILQERDVKQERGRPRKQYLVRWKESWVDGARLTAPELLQNWREKKAPLNRRRRVHGTS